MFDRAVELSAPFRNPHCDLPDADRRNERVLGLIDRARAFGVSRFGSLARQIHVAVSSTITTHGRGALPLAEVAALLGDASGRSG
jgi:hypothetical protein